MDENTIKVLALFTQVGTPWPIGAWVFRIGTIYNNRDWYQVRKNMYHPSMSRFYYNRESDELSELEANYQGIFRE